MASVVDVSRSWSADLWDFGDASEAKILLAIHAIATVVINTGAAATGYHRAGAVNVVIPKTV